MSSERLLSRIPNYVASTCPHAVKGAADDDMKGPFYPISRENALEEMRGANANKIIRIGDRKYCRAGVERQPLEQLAFLNDALEARTKPPEAMRVPSHRNTMSAKDKRMLARITMRQEHGERAAFAPIDGSCGLNTFANHEHWAKKFGLPLDNNLSVEISKFERKHNKWHRPYHIRPDPNGPAFCSNVTGNWDTSHRLLSRDRQLADDIDAVRLENQDALERPATSQIMRDFIHCSQQKGQEECENKDMTDAPYNGKISSAMACHWLRDPGHEARCVARTATRVDGRRHVYDSFHDIERRDARSRLRARLGMVTHHGASGYEALEASVNDGRV